MKKIHNLIIVDESGSMSTIEKQAVSGMLETLKGINDSQKRMPEVVQTVTLMTFNSNHINYLYNCTMAEGVNPYDIQYLPGGCTPLYDAVGSGISRIMEMAAKEDGVIVTIITDGYENASTRYNLNDIKRLIDQQKEMGWTIALIGTDDLNVASMADSMSISNHLSFSKDERTTSRMFAEINRAREARVCCMANDDVLDAAAPFFSVSSLSSDDDIDDESSR